ncbi:MAG: SO_0444 family Cu/Zn efflux transporter [Pseudomonadales bacterium]|nr:SO_0444 family Cu/Zn efflux transporter [Pseudomonadales bacterium]
MTLLTNFWDLVIESAPWLLVGYLLAGIIKQVIPNSWVEKQLAKPGLVSVIKGAVIGAPLPLCSCGVIPTALAIRKAGASKGATASFLVATPETGVDSISYSYAILGPVFAIARPIGALISAVTAGILVRVMDVDDNLVVEKKTCGSCCGSAESEPAGLSMGEKLKSAVQYGFGRMISDTGKWLTIGLVAATVITTYVPQSFFLQWGDGLLAMLIMILVGLPMYICATASTPVAASLLFAGVSPGAALVFLLTGPATNIATMGVIREQLGNRSLAAYLIGVISMAILFGLGLNQLFQIFNWSLQLNIMEHGESWPLWRQLAAVLLSVLVLRMFLQPVLTRLFSSSTSQQDGRESGDPVTREAT